MPGPSGPLAGVKVLELAGIGPGPMCAMLLADLGATVLRIDRPEPAALGIKRPLRYNLLLRSRETLALDLKSSAAKALILTLTEQADGVIEGFRPGVIERLGLGPDVLLERNPRLVVGRMTGWGQAGPLAQTAGHDINYIALTGALSMLGSPQTPPPPPLNVIGDYAGGALYLALGMVSAIFSARVTGAGQVVDAAIVDGVASLMTTFQGMFAAGMLAPERGANILDGGAHFYGCYECAGGGYMAVGPIEEKFYGQLLETLQLNPAALPAQMDRGGWQSMRETLAARFRTRTRDEWAAIFADSDACVSPVLSLRESAAHPHLAARGSYVEVDGVVQSAPAPRFSVTPCAIPTPPREADNDAALAAWLVPEEISKLRESGVIS